MDLQLLVLALDLSHSALQSGDLFFQLLDDGLSLCQVDYLVSLCLGLLLVLDQSLPQVTDLALVELGEVRVRLTDLLHLAVEGVDVPDLGALQEEVGLMQVRDLLVSLL